jgi:carboxyl-terminal processing protease
MVAHTMTRYTACLLALAICHLNPANGAAAQSFPSPLPFKLDRARTVFVRTWQFIAENYVDPHFNGLDWEAVGRAYEAKARRAETHAEFYRLMAEMVGQLDDGHSVFLPPAQASALQSHRIGGNRTAITGLAASIRPMPDGSLLILQVVPNTQAEALLRPGDRILAVDGMSLSQVERAADALFGSEGVVTVTLQSPGDRPRDVAIARETYSLSQLPPPVFARRLDQEIGYIAIYDFLSFTAEMRVREALKGLLRGGPMRGLIIDVRANDGGIIGQMVNVLGLFINGGPAGEYVGRRTGDVDVYTIPAGRTLRELAGLPIAVLTGPSTHSAGEIFAAVMQSHRRAQVVGSPTAGNVEMLHALRLPDGSMAWIAVKHYRAPDGRRLEGRGVRPDHLVPVEWWRYALDDDPQVLAAVALLRGVERSPIAQDQRVHRGPLDQ